MSKINPSHLARSAYIYIRQSTPEQVQNNLESQRRQYGLSEQARQLGFHDVHVIDEDLGRSGTGHVDRDGFEAMLGAVCQGQVGAVFAVEASRLARNGHEWHRLLEFCGIVDTLIVDHDGVYDPKHPNDRLLLGLKGTMSEMETATFRQRSQEAIRQMARRGVYHTRIPEGYVLRGPGRLEKDPDEQVRRALELVFSKFRELSSARQVSLWFRQEEILVPKRMSPLADPVDFVPATAWRITGLLKNPAYAGVYAFGRTRRRVVLKEGRKRHVKDRRSKPDQWQVLLQDHHEGYITWPEYLTNQERLEQNRNALGEAVSGAARPGKGLLAGLVRCGLCGRKMRVRYSGRRRRDSLVVYYYCVAAERETVGKQLCSTFGGVTVERAVVEAVLDALEPARMEAMLEAAAQLATRRTEKQRQVELELERARYEADRRARQYSQVEPENRLVARTLETCWNEAMERVRALEQECAQLSVGQEIALAEDQEPLRRLALDLPRLWHHPSAPIDLRKRILRTVLKEIVVYVEKSRLRVLIHWQGGQHSELSLRKRRAGEHRWTTSVETVDLIRQLARRMMDKQLAAQLNRLGIKTAKGHTWTRIRVGNFRTIHEIPNYSPGEREARGELTLEEAATQLGVSYSTVQRMIQRRQLPAQQLCPGGPWALRAEDVEALRTQNGTKPSRKNRPSSPYRDQQTLVFPEDI
ncbi:MAG: recombinase family protein [Acetobacteraceae bacterium]